MRRSKGLWSSGIATAAALALATLVLSSVPAHAQVKPGDFISADNAARVKDLVSPGTYLRIQHGMSLKIAPSERIDWPPPYKEATEKYSSPRRSGSRPTAAAWMVMYRENHSRSSTPMTPMPQRRLCGTSRFVRSPATTTICDGSIAPALIGGSTQSYREINDYEVGHYAGYNEVGRTEVDPVSIDPDFKSTGRYFLSLLYPVLSPQSDRGSGFIRYRYASAQRDDDIWSYSTGSRGCSINYSRHHGQCDGTGEKLHATIMRASAARTSSTISSSSARRTCCAQSTSAIRRTCDARPTVARAIALIRGRFATTS